MEVYTCDSESYVVYYSLAFLMLDLETCVILYGKDGTKRSYDIANFGTRKCAMIKAVVLSWMTDALWNGHVEIL